MSSNNVQQGIALICGAAAYGLALVAGVGSGPALGLGVVVGGVVLVAQGQMGANKVASEENEQKPKSTPKKAKKENKTPKKQAPLSPPVVAKPAKAEAPAVSEKAAGGKKKKKSKKDKVAEPVTPVKAVPQEQKKSPEPEVKEQELSKSQQRKQKLKQKKEAEEKKKAEEAEKLAAEQKREAAQKKKKEAKARKAAAKAAEQKPDLPAQPKPVVEEVLEPGWEKPSTRKQTKGQKEKKEDEKKKDAGVVAIEVKIPIRAHPLIIGKGGSGLEALRTALNVTIQMPKRDTTEYILVKGLPQNVAEAKRALEQIAEKGYSSVTHPGFVSQDMVLTDRSQIGVIFGTRGVNIQAIQKSTHAKIQMPDKDSEDLTITISGEPNEIHNAVEAIQDLLDHGYSKVTHPGWTTEEVQVPPELIGVIIGKEGSKIRQLSTENKVKIETPKRDDPTARQDVVTIKGTLKNIAKTKEAINEIIASAEQPVETDVPDPAWQEDVQEPSWD